MEELTKKKKGNLIDLVISEYENTSSPAFGKNATTVREILLRKYPTEKSLDAGFCKKRTRKALLDLCHDSSGTTTKKI